MSNTKNNNGWNIGFKDLFKGVEFHQDKVNPSIEIPDSFFQRLLDYFMERSYLNETENRNFNALQSVHGNINWLRITHLPVNPSNDESYDLLGRWQSVLSTMHAWDYRMLFFLLRDKGETRIYLGTTSFTQNITAAEAVEQLREAATGSMPGIGLEHVKAEDMNVYNEIIAPLNAMPDVGAVTGIPSFRSENMSSITQLQTLDSLAFGLRDKNGYDRNYALLVIADPLSDSDAASLISRLRDLSSKIHLNVSRSVNESKSSSESKEKGLGGYGGAAMGNVAGGLLGTVAGLIPGVGSFLKPLVSSLASGAVVMSSAKNAKNISLSSSSSVTTEYLDKYAQYAEQLLEKHIARLQQGRNLGFWNTGVYVLGKPADIRTVTGILRSVYSGQESYIEPIRTHLFSNNSGAKNIISGFDLIPLVNKEKLERDGYQAAQGEWHILGKPYQYLSTPMNTAELSLTTSLPHRDVPGLRFIKTAVRFASNSADPEADTVKLGNFVDMGVVQSVPYNIDPNMLVRHAFVCGTTGCGKTTTCKNLVNEVMKRDIPVLIIEPAKDDYVRWAIEKNKTLPPEKRIRIYMPGGTKNYEGAEELKLNLFQPAAVKDANIDLMQHSENLSMLINACLPSEEVVPILIDETINQKVTEFVGDDFDPSDMPQMRGYPAISGLIDTAMDVMDGKGYDPRVRENMKEILLTRFNYLRRGIRGNVFNVNKSTDFDEMFSHTAVINISRLAGSKEKSLIMSMLLLALYEYSNSAYQNDEEYRSQAQSNKLMHLTLIEEAHNVLSDPPKGNYADPRQAAADLFSNILSEIRGYGQGIVVVDQTPVKMIPDVMKNTNLKICHRLQHPDDCEVMSKSLALRDDQKMMLMSLEMGNAIVCGDMDDAAAWVKMPKP